MTRGMTSIDPIAESSQNAWPLLTVVQTVRRRLLATTLGAAACWGVVAAGIVLFVCAWIDLAVDLPGGARLACDLAAVGGAIAVLVRLAITALRDGSTLAIARRLDDVAQTQGQILSAVDLATARREDSPLTTGLARMAVKDAATIVRSAQTSVAAPLSIMNKPAFIFAGILVLIGFTAIGEPNLVSTQWLRFVDPFGDHPPFSRLSFAVDPGDTRVIYGGAVDVRATVHGGTAERVELVLNNGGAAADPLPMFPEGDGKWRATLVGVTVPGRYLVRSGRARSSQYNLDVITVPKLQDVRFRVTLPAYTNRPPYDGPLPQNGLSGLPGTTVEIHAKSNRPLSGGTVHFAPASTPATQPAADIALAPTSPGSNECVGTFQIQSAGRITLGVSDTDGQPSTDTLTAAVNLLTDERPFVRMMEPRPNSFATPDALIKVSALAEDDYGLSTVSILRGLNDSRPRPTPSTLPSPAPTQFSATTELNLGEYKLQPDDVIKVFARAQDNDPAGAKGSESSVVTVRVVSQKDMDRMLVARDGMETLQSKYASAERRVEAIKDKLDKLEKELEQLDPKSDLADAKRKEIEKLSEEMNQAAAEIAKLADHDLPFDIDHALTQTLKDLAAQVAAAAAQAKDAANPGMSVVGAIDKLKQIDQQLGGQRQQFHDDANVPLEHLAKIFPLLEDQARFIDLYARQKDLAQRLSGVADKDGADDPQQKARMRDMQDEQHQIRHDLHELLDDIDNHVASLPDDKRLDDLRDTARHFSAAVADSTAAGQMQETEQSLQDFGGSSAADHGKAAADTLSQFLDRVNIMGGQGQACLKFQPKLAEGIGNTVEQMLGSMNLGTGLGMAGSAGGYSAMRSSLQNVGLYGALPTRAEESGANGGGQADHGVATGGAGGPDGQNNPDGANSTAKQQASGSGDAPVPAQYRKSVGEYFRRVADELSD